MTQHHLVVLTLSRIVQFDSIYDLSQRVFVDGTFGLRGSSL
jgi:hypothetical protein